MKRVFLILAGIVLLASCKKEDSEITTIPPDQALNYMPLEIGNYWAYQIVSINPDGSETINQQMDSTIIVGDTMIRNELYYDMYNPDQDRSSYLRDSSGFLVNSNGKIVFYDQPGFIVEDTIQAPAVTVIEYSLQPTDTVITVPFGTFDAVTYRGTVTVLDTAYHHGVQYIYSFYAADVGQIKNSSYFFSSPDHRLEKRLSSFGNINIGKSQDASW